MDTNEFLQKIKSTVLVFDPQAEVILFGSRARGDYRNDSDWDVLVVTKKKVDAKVKRTIRDSICDLELEYLQAVSTIIVERKTWEDWAIMPLYKNIQKEGVRL